MIEQGIGDRLSDGGFVRLRRYLQRVAGLHLDDSRRAALSLAAAETARAQCLAGPDDLVDLLCSAPSPTRSLARARLLDEVTIGETHFFRNPPQIDALRRVILPELLARAADEGRTATIWSAGASTGEEPYTVAMLLLDLLGPSASRSARVLGSDISQAALRAARVGRYGTRSVLLAAPADRDRWLMQHSDGWLVRPEVRDLVGFVAHHLGDAPPLAPSSVDLVVCRNVTIYFDRATTAAVIRRFYDVLRPGGYLLLGHAESLWQREEDFELVGVGDAFIYRRPLRCSTDGPPSDRSHWGRPASGLPDVAVRPSAPGTHCVSPGRVPVASTALGQRALPTPRSASPNESTPDGRPADSPLALARAAQLAGRYAEAALLASRASHADPTLVAAYVVEGHALITLNRDAEAVTPLRKAAYLCPDAGDAHFLLAGAQDRLGYSASAAREYRLAAQTLRRVASEELAAILLGRGLDELVSLCEHLARRSARGDGGGS